MTLGTCQMGEIRPQADGKRSVSWNAGRPTDGPERGSIRQTRGLLDVTDKFPYLFPTTKTWQQILGSWSRWMIHPLEWHSRLTGHCQLTVPLRQSPPRTMRLALACSYWRKNGALDSTSSSAFFTSSVNLTCPK